MQRAHTWASLAVVIMLSASIHASSGFGMDDTTDTAQIEAVVNSLLDHAESSPLRPDADPVATVSLLLARDDHNDDVDSVVLQWDHQPPIVVSAHAAAQRRLLTAVPPLDDLLATIKQPFADKVLSLDAEADYTKTTAAFIKNTRRDKVSKDELLGRVCEPPVVTPSKQVPSRCVGPAAILNLVPATCEVTYIAANKTRVYRCQAARLVLVRNPAFCNKAYRSAAAFRGPFCIVRKLFGNTTTLSLNGGTLRVDLGDAKEETTRSVLDRLGDGLGDKLGSGGTFVLESMSERAVRAAVGRVIEQGVSLASALFGNKGL